MSNPKITHSPRIDKAIEILQQESYAFVDILDDVMDRIFNDCITPTNSAEILEVIRSIREIKRLVNDLNPEKS